jgi:hypothetical protein
MAEAGCRRAGVLEYDSLPAGLYDEIVGAAPGVALEDLGNTFAVRRGIDAAERGLIGRADALAVAALNEVAADRLKDAGEAAGFVEKSARLGGAEEAYIAVAADLDADARMVRVAGTLPLAPRFAVRASIAYKGSWVRRVRSFARDDTARFAFTAADAWLSRAMSSIGPGQPIGAQLASHVKELPGGSLRNWMAESCIGSYPLETVATPGADAAPVSGSLLVVTIELSLGGVRWLGAAPAFGK